MLEGRALARDPRGPRFRNDGPDAILRGAPVQRDHSRQGFRASATL
jgi:hypothetical protein